MAADQQQERIPEDTWFRYITGASEKDFSAQREKHIVAAKAEPKPGSDGRPVPHIVVRNPEKGVDHDAGFFYLASIASLRKAAAEQQKQQRSSSSSSQQQQQPAKFEMLIRGDWESMRRVDIAALQADPANAGAMFQAASNFNGVEAAGDSVAPDSESFTEYYVYDRTQGPAASVSAPAAAISRVHAAFFDPDKPPSEWNQTATRQAQMLGDLATHFTVENGYVVNQKGKEQPLPDDPAERDKLLAKVKVGVHLDVLAEFGDRTADGMAVNAHPHRINQVFCAAMNIQQGVTGSRNAALKDGREKAKFLLRAAYHGTYLAAIANGCKKLYLTMIGGGAFGNWFEDIFEAILDAHTKLTPGSCLEQVYLVLFAMPPGLDEFVAELNKHKVPYKKVTFINNEPTDTSSMSQ